MKTKSLAAILSLSAAAGIAGAQDNIQIYGSIDAGLTFERGGAAGSVNKLATGVTGGNRLGFRGTEDLGGGLDAHFVLENGYLVDTGTLGQGGLLFGRQAYVGIKGNFGTVNLGRQYSPHFYALGFVADPFGSGLSGQANNVMDQDTIRTNNALLYATPAFGGVSADLMYAPGEVAGDNSLGRTLGGSLKYAAGSLNLILAHHNRNGATAGVAKTKNTLLAGTYDFGTFKLHAAVGKNEGPASLGSPDNREALIGATIPFGASKVLLSYIRKDDRTAANVDARQFGIGYTYNLSKRTYLYAAYATISDNRGLLYKVGNASDLGTGDKAFNLGVRHNF
jgi:predicted porin